MRISNSYCVGLGFEWAVRETLRDVFWRVPVLPTSKEVLI